MKPLFIHLCTFLILLFSTPLVAQDPADLTLFFEGGDSHEATFFFDINDDALPDLILIGEKGISIHEQLPNGDYKRVQKITDGVSVPADFYQGPTRAYRFIVVPLDVDSDGDQDILTIRDVAGGPAIVWYENEGAPAYFSAAQVVANVDANYINNLVVADFDGNEVLDFAILHEATSPILLYPLEIVGNLPQALAPVELAHDLAERIYADDLDMDNDPDLVYIAGEEKKIAWLENLGSLAFNPYDVLANDATQIMNLDIADLDGDGDKDLVAALRSQDRVVWYEQTGPGTNFSNLIEIASVFRLADIQIADLDGDDTPDLQVQSFRLINNFDGNTVESKQYVLLNETGDASFPGTFQEVDFDNANTIFDPQKLEGRAIRDMDGDGDLDFLFYNYNEQVISWAENTDGWLAPLQLSQQILEVFFTFFQYADLADVDGDGRLDVVAGTFDGEDHGRMMLATQKYGPGQFKVHAVYGDDAPETLNLYHNRGFFADLDGDGDQDVIGGVGDLLVYAENTGQGFSLFKSQFARDKGIDIGDFNQDGAMEAVAVRDGSNSLRIINGASSDPLVLGEVALYSINQGNEVHVGDINSDGELDIAVKYGGAHDSEILAFINQGSGADWALEEVYLSSFPGFTGIGFRQIELDDFDSDGDLDIVGYYKNPWTSPGQDNSNTITWLENEGNGNYSDRQTIFSEPNSDTWSYVWNNFHKADVNGDGYQDFIVEGVLDQVVCFLKEDGQAAISTAFSMLNSGSAYRYLGYEDVDGDAIIEFVYGHNLEGKIFIQENAFMDFGDALEVSGAVFMDLNENGVLDTDELLYLNSVVSAGQFGLFNFNNDGMYTLNLPPGQHTVELTIPQGWAPTNPASGAYDIELVDMPNDTLDFGIVPLEILYGGTVDLDLDGLVCNTTGTGQLSFQNSSTLPISGVLRLSWHPLFSLNPATPVPTNTGPEFWEWEIVDLYPGHTFTVDFSYVNPDETYVGSYIFMAGEFEGLDENGMLLFEDEDLYELEATCAYDPNDKLVEPLRDEIAHYVLYEDTLQYTVRFQNTGNLPATDVVIRDTLDANLDWFTFRPVSASHDHDLTLDMNTGELVYSFLGIMLPDSVNNEPESHGFIKYEIEPRQDAPEGTVLTNRAGIYFDLNAPIITNTVFNTLVSELPFTGNCEFEPAISTDQSAPDGIYCPETILQLTASAGDTYAWFVSEYPAAFGGVPLGLATQDIQVNVSDFADGAYFYCEVTIDGCTDAAGVIYAAELNLPEVPIIDPIIDGPICEGEVLTLNIPMAMFEEIRWLKDGVVIPGANDSSLEVMESGQYSVEVSFSACPGYFQELVAFDPLEVIVHMDGELGILVEDNLLTAVAGFSYQWYLDGNPIPGATDQTYTALENGVYVVELTDSFGCSFFSSEEQVILDQVIEQHASTLRWYPNPVEEVLFISSEQAIQSIEFFTVDGQLYKRERLQNEQSSRFETATWPTGVYFTRVRMEDGRVEVFYWVKG